VAQIQEQLDAIQPGLPRTGGRTGLWNRLLWTRMIQAFQGSAGVAAAATAAPENDIVVMGEPLLKK
jgi:hypothetical protein